jgi:prepilin-type N-terminal cleavage/methylation domain-containing protein
MTSQPMSVQTLRRRIQRADDETGFTLVELVVTMAVMSIVATAMMAVAMRSFTTTSTITNRRDVLVDGRVAIDQMTKQLRQATSIDLGASDESTLKFDTYVNGAPATIIWRVTGLGAPYTLEQSRDGDIVPPHFAALVSPLVCKTSLDAGCTLHPPFSWVLQAGVIDQVTIDLTFQTSTSTVDLISDVQLRNATGE